MPLLWNFPVRGINTKKCQTANFKRVAEGVSKRSITSSIASVTSRWTCRHSNVHRSSTDARIEINVRSILENKRPASAVVTDSVARTRSRIDDHCSWLVDWPGQDESPTIAIIAHIAGWTTTGLHWTHEFSTLLLQPIVCELANLLPTLLPR